MMLCACFAVCKQTFAHKRCLQAMTTERGGVSSVPAAVPLQRAKAETHVPFIASASATTVEVELTSKVVVNAPPSWLTWHRITVPVTWIGDFSIRPGKNATTITSDRIKACVEIVTTVVVTELRGDNNEDGHAGVENVEYIDIQSVSTSSMVIEPIQGFAATDKVDVNVRWTTDTRVDVIRVPVAAG